MQIRPFVCSQHGGAAVEYPENKDGIFFFFSLYTSEDWVAIDSEHFIYFGGIFKREFQYFYIWAVFECADDSYLTNGFGIAHVNILS